MKYRIIFFALVFSILFFIFSNVTFAFNFGTDSGLWKTGDQAGYINMYISEDNLPTVIGWYIGIALSFIGILFFVLMVYGGYMWMTARGNDQQTEKAKNIIVNSIVGIVIVVSAYAITSFVQNSIKTTKNPAELEGFTDSFETCKPPNCIWVNGEATYVEVDDPFWDFWD